MKIGNIGKAGDLLIEYERIKNNMIFLSSLKGENYIELLYRCCDGKNLNYAIYDKDLIEMIINKELKNLNQHMSEIEEQIKEL